MGEMLGILISGKKAVGILIGITLDQ